MTGYEDPFEVLGVALDVDETELRRAYGRLLRQHRPDRDPEGFQRVRGAYEAALQRRAWSRQELWEPLDSAAEQEPDEAPGAEPAVSEPAVSEPAVSEPAVSEPAVSEPTVSELHIEAADRKELVQCSLAELVQRLGPAGAASFYDERCQVRLVDGRWDELADEMLGEEFLGLLARHAELERSVLRVSAAIGWSDPARSEALIRGMDWHEAAEHFIEDTGTLARSLSPQLERAAGWPLSPPLDRLVRLLPVVDAEHEARLIDDALLHASAEPLVFVAAMATLPPSMLQLVGEVASAPAEEEQPGSSESLGPLLGDLEKAISNDSRDQMWTTAIGLSALAVVPLGLQFGWKGAGGAAILFLLVLVVPVSYIDGSLYRDHMQPALIRFVLSTGNEPSQLADAISQYKASSVIRRFASSVREDRALELLGRLVVGQRARRGRR